MKTALHVSQSKQKRRAILLVLPLLLFVVLTFLVPIGQMLVQSAYNPLFSDAAPSLREWFRTHGADQTPDEAAYAALAADLRYMKQENLVGQASSRINYKVPGARSIFRTTARLSDELLPPYRKAFLDIDERWGNKELWGAMRSASSSFTSDFYLAALDLSRSETGTIERAPLDQRVYGTLFGRTLVLSTVITLICLVIGFPVAHLLARLPLAKSNLLMILVLLPFWTSLLVRTSSWIVLLQTNGVINSFLVSTGLISDDQRLQMIYNQTGTVIAMTHVLLPFMILALYAVMRSISPLYMRAARSLGANGWTAFWRVYVPQTLPGIAAGSLLVFIQSIGYYITPALVGGASGQLISNLIAYHMQASLNWSLAAALASILLVVILLLYWIYDRLVGIDNMKFS